MATTRSRPKERIGFGEAKIVRDCPGSLVIEETHFPIWLWWSCLSALWFGLSAIGGLTWVGLLVLLVAYVVIMVPLLLAVSAHGYQRLSIRDGEAILVSRVPHIGKCKPKRLPLETVDFISCGKQLISTSQEDKGSEHLVITAFLKNGVSDTLMTVPYCKKTVAALQNHLTGILAADDTDTSIQQGQRWPGPVFKPSSPWPSESPPAPPTAPGASSPEAHP